MIFICVYSTCFHYSHVIFNIIGMGYIHIVYVGTYTLADLPSGFIYLILMHLFIDIYLTYLFIKRIYIEYLF